MQLHHIIETSDNVLLAVIHLINLQKRTTKITTKIMINYIYSISKMFYKTIIIKLVAFFYFRQLAFLSVIFNMYVPATNTCRRFFLP